MQTILHEKFVTDKNGKRTAVILEVKEYEKMLALLEEAHILNIVREGEKEYRQRKLKPIRSMAELEK